jgi:membrane-bound lytic murein transglycosylase B
LKARLRMFLFSSFSLLVVGLSICQLFFPLFAEPVSAESGGSFTALQSRLADDGFDPNMLNALFQRTEVQFEPRTAALLFMHSEARINYDKFLSSESIQNARKYVQDHFSDLTVAEDTYGVKKEVIVAIMLVETRLGSYVGNNSILNTLCSISAVKDSEFRQIVWDCIQPERRPSRSKFEEKANTKSAWAYQELKAFLKYTSREKIDPTRVYGSYAGALGLAQFMPSSILTYGRDGNHDGKIDLFNPSDAIMSIGNYLKQFGWKPGIGWDEAFDVVYHYNHSRVYVTTVLKIADLLKG